MSQVALQCSPAHHPETERLLAIDCWTDDPAVAALVGAVNSLMPIGESMRDLSARRPSIDRLIADEIGFFLWETAETARVNVWRREPRVSGIISVIWTELENLRARWIAARLRFEDLSPAAPDVEPWYERFQALEESAPTVTALWDNTAAERPPAEARSAG